MIDSPATLARCSWAAGSANERLVLYHDTEWGVPLRDDRALFELFSLVGFAAGLNWAVVLNKREAFREAFDNFDPELVAHYDAVRIDELVANAAIVRNRAKIEATVANAAALAVLQRDAGSLTSFVWAFVDNVPRIGRPATEADVPAACVESNALSAELKARGFRFAGQTVCYAFMQAAGLVDDHLAACFRAAPSP